MKWAEVSLSEGIIMAEQKIIRCAIYKRKSREDDSEQEFNSLDAQRLAGAKLHCKPNA